jgi:hypothetical protein
MLYIRCLQLIYSYLRSGLTAIGCLICIYTSAADNRNDTTPFSTTQAALAYLDSIGSFQQSTYWPNVHPAPFMANLRKNVKEPLTIYEGISTNFCAYAALSYLPLHNDPLNFVRFMSTIYNKGTAMYGKEYFEPTEEVKQSAGRLSFKGELDVRPADQLWFMVLADHFKGYLNFFDHHFDMGDENTFWASVNYAKFNRMIRKLFHYKTDAVGSDLVRPGIRDIYQYLSERLKTGNVALFVNNPSLYKKNHSKIRLGIPTHYIILLRVEMVDDKIAFTYWDYGGKSLQLLKPEFLKKIIFGISHITPVTAHEK